ncbi:MAG: Uma2 family endonuclease [Peptococcaceae bacterium]|jgi:Uma2 family endonuclease|nr:Uma2 family endonuclease [Peptococcaceae bacterium]
MGRIIGGSEEISLEEWFDTGEGVMVEVFDGKKLYMDAPSIQHQIVAAKLGNILGNLLSGSDCVVINAPNVVLDQAKKDFFIPDLVVHCNHSNAKLTAKAIVGAPCLIVEILSISSIGRDAIIKNNKYAEAGVSEYWMINIDSREVIVGRLNNGKYEFHMYRGGDILRFDMTGQDIQVDEVFESVF